MLNQIINYVKDRTRLINWPLLIFLLLVLNVKLILKVSAILISVS